MPGSGEQSKQECRKSCSPLFTFSVETQTRQGRNKCLSDASFQWAEQVTSTGSWKNRQRPVSWSSDSRQGQTQMRSMPVLTHSSVGMAAHPVPLWRDLHWLPACQRKEPPAKCQTMPRGVQGALAQCLGGVLSGCRGWRRSGKFTERFKRRVDTLQAVKGEGRPVQTKVHHEQRPGGENQADVLRGIIRHIR